MKKISVVLAFAALVASGTAMAQGTGDNSETTMCRNRLEQAQLRAQSMTADSKQGELLKAIQSARGAMASGNSTKCIADLDKVGN